MSELVTLEDLDIALTRILREAASLDSDLLIYLISIAILYVRRKSASLGGTAEAKPTQLKLVAV